MCSVSISIFVVVILLLELQPCALLLTDASFIDAHSCCSHIDSHDDILQCIAASSISLDRMTINSSSTSQQISHDASSSERHAPLLFTTFYSREIANYAASNALTNAYYLSGLPIQPTLRVLSEMTGDDYFPEDKRWNKIQAIPNALRTWARDCKALVFLDADVVLLDHGFRFDYVLRAHPQADLIACEDALDTINTGVLVVRNTPWVLELFDLWLAKKGSRNTFCDQHVFNLIFKEVLIPRGELYKIAILPATTFNSRWPALETFDPSEAVLHLMGESSAFRTVVAKHIAQTTCQLWQQTQKLPLGAVSIAGDSTDSMVKVPLTRRKLVDLALLTMRQERDRWVTTIEGMLQWGLPSSTDASADIEIAFSKLHSATCSLCDDSRPSLAIDPADCVEYFEQNLAMLMQMVGHHNSSMHAEALTLALLQEAAKTQFKVVYFLPNNLKRAGGIRCLEILDRLALMVDPQQPGNMLYLRHKRGILFASLAVYAQQLGDWQQALDDGKASIDELGLLLNDLDRGHVDFPSYVQEYVNSARTLSESFRMTGQLDSALQWSQIALHNARALFDDYAGEERLAKQQLAHLALAVARSAAAVGQRKLALEHIDIAQEAAKFFGDDNYDEFHFKRLRDQLSTVVEAD